MTLAEQLRQYNQWRRGGGDPMPNPRELGKTIDAAADRLELLEIVEKAARNLCKVRGRHHSEIAMRKLMEVFGYEQDKAHKAPSDAPM